MLVALSALWGGSFFFNAVAVAALPVFTVVVVRVALGALILLAVLRLAGQRMPSQGRVWAAFFGAGLLNNAIPFSLIVWGQQPYRVAGSPRSSTPSTPLFTVVFATCPDRRRADDRRTGRRACWSASRASR